MINIETASYSELLQEWEECQKLWSKYSCDCFGYYIQALHRKIESLGGWPARK